MKKYVFSVITAGVCAAVAVAGLQPVEAWKPKPKARSWKHQGLTGVRGVDVSRWQHIGPGVLDFDTLQAQGVRFAVIKSGDTNSSAHSEARYWYSRDKVAARNAGLLVGAYYYATPTSNSSAVVSDARAQARKASRQVGGQLPQGHLPLALDLETTATRLGRADLTRWALTWLRVVEKRTGRKPWFYSYTTYVEKKMLPDPELQSYPFWHANWGLFLKDRPMTIKGWPADHGQIWQFTDNGRLAGSGSRVIDLNEYRGTGEELLREAGLTRKDGADYDIDPDQAPTYRDEPAPTPTATGDSSDG